VAALIKQDSGADADLEPGGRGELSVWVDGKKVVEKTMRGFPGDADVLKAVKAVLEPAASKR
jgi:predicted Rdx family selenoprotein